MTAHMAMNMFIRPLPRIATIARTRTTSGNAKKTSTIRIRIVSTIPPIVPATSPTSVPNVNVTRVAPNAMSMSTRPA